jgi:hypothetical protein
MHNDTPLGTIMHFKELDRKAAPKSSALRSRLKGAGVAPFPALLRWRFCGAFALSSPERGARVATSFSVFSQRDSLFQPE